MYALVIGKRRQGKSTLSMSLALAKSDTVIVYDPNTQFREWGDPMSVDQIENALLAPEPYQDTPNEETREVVVKNVYKNVYIFRPTNPPYDSPEDGFSELAEMLWYWEDFTLIVDEASTVQSQHNMNSKLERMIRQGPANVHVVQASHRVVDFHRFSRAMGTDFFFFRTPERKDVARISEEYDRRMERILPYLGVYELAHHWQASGGIESTSVWRCPKDWFVELGHREKEVLTGDESPQEQETQQRLIEMPGLVPADEDPALDDIRKGKL